MILIEDIGIYKRCSLLEILFLLIPTFFIVLLPLLIFLDFITGVFVAIIIAVSITLTLTVNILQSIKRNKPNNFYYKKIVLFMFNTFKSNNIKLNMLERYSSYSRY